jgi:hypothetical protein
MSAEIPKRITDTPREPRARRVVASAVSAPLEQRIERVRQAARRLGSNGTNIASRIRPQVPKTS